MKNKELKDVCFKYDEMIFGSKAFSYTASFLIVMFNLVIRIVNIMIIKKIGYDKKSDVTTEVMRKVLMASFLNTGLLLLLVNANLEDAPFPLNYIPLRGEYKDMNTQWYIHTSKALV